MNAPATPMRVSDTLEKTAAAFERECTWTQCNPLRYCPTCTAMSEMAEDGTCLECLSIIDLTLWQETEEAWASDARAMECAEPVDPFFASDRALNRGYGRL